MNSKHIEVVAYRIVVVSALYVVQGNGHQPVPTYLEGKIQMESASPAIQQISSFFRFWFKHIMNYSFEQDSTPYAGIAVWLQFTRFS